MAGSAGVAHELGEINDGSPRGEIREQQFGLSPSRMKGAFRNEGALTVFWQ